MFDRGAHGDDGVGCPPGECEVCHAEAVYLGVGGEVLVDAFQCYGIVVEVEAELACHGCEFAGFVAEHGYELLCGHGFDASVASLEALYGEVEFRFGFFEVCNGFFDGSGFGELVDESFAFDAAFMLADDDAGFGWIVDGLLAVGDHGFAEFVVGVLQVGYDDD